MQKNLAIRLSHYIQSDPCLLGEFLRDVTFPESGESGYGCYSTFTTEVTFEEVYKNTPQWDEAIRDILGVPSEDDPNYNEEYYGYVDEAYVYYSEIYDILVAWHWDHDGILMFKHGPYKLINTDCKKSTTWEWINNESLQETNTLVEDR
jgi:hypothetical protein